MPESMQAGDVLADRYRLDDLLAESGGGRFWRALDQVLHRPVAVHVLPAGDPRADRLLDAARTAGPGADRRLLRVLDADVLDGRCYVVNEWGHGESLDNLLVREGPLTPRRAASLVADVADSIAEAHTAGLAHGRLAPENILIDQHGQVRIIGFGVDAALHGLPPRRISVDEIDLVALLYCALTGRWPGVSTSQMPAAPEDHDSVLRPRRVRAGIPRLLDAICDHGLNPVAADSPRDLTARHLADQLHSYVGDVTGATVAVAAVPRTPTVELPEADAAAADVANADPVTIGVSPDLPPPIDLPTQAGMPVFHDDDEVDWLRARTEPVTPPPPLDDLPPRPLFAPDPPDGEPVRRARPGSRAADAPPVYWPWDSARDPGTDSSSQPAAGLDTGSWASGSGSGDRWGTGEGMDDTGEQMPGRSWFRLAMIVGACVLVLVAAAAAYQLGLKPPTPGDDTPTEEPTSQEPSKTKPAKFTDLVAADFDPQGAEPREENPDQVANAIDGDPATAWTTSTYRQNFGPAGLKSGVGLIVDLGAAKGVRQVVVSTAGGATSLAAYVTTTAPTGIAVLTPVGTASGTGDLTISVDEAVSGRFVTVWLTLLPPVDGGFRGTITEVRVLG